MSIFNIAIIGIGRVGGALAIALSKKGYAVTQLVTRSYEKARRIAELIEPRPQILSSQELEKISADAVFICTPDAEIVRVAENLCARLENLPYIFHTSGALSSETLRALGDAGCAVASVHPLISISEPEAGAEFFANAYFCLEGDAEAIATAQQLVADLGGAPFSIETKYKTLYHAAAVTACGHLVALVAAAIEMLGDCGLGEAEAQQILLPLVKSTVQNLSHQTPPEALTGTFARADVETLRKHLHVLRDAPELLEIYRALGARSLSLAARQGANRENLERMKRLLVESG